MDTHTNPSRYMWAMTSATRPWTPAAAASTSRHRVAASVAKYSRGESSFAHMYMDPVPRPRLPDP